MISQAQVQTGSVPRASLDELAETQALSEDQASNDPQPQLSASKYRLPHISILKPEDVFLNLL